uniref:Uncharacterized protein n=1 Tax=Chrysotila carterae TaxID=13221 RepID=A0A7S4BGX5_CHRCT
MSSMLRMQALRTAFLNERMAAERQYIQFRRKRAENYQTESRRTKPTTEIARIRRELSEKPRCVPRRPREGQQWTLEVPLQGDNLAEPELTSHGECDQRTRDCAGAHAGPEQASLLGRNRHEAGKRRNKHQTLSVWTWMLVAMFCVKQEAVTKQLPVTEEERQTNVSWQPMNGRRIAGKHSQKEIGHHSHGTQHDITPDIQMLTQTEPRLQQSVPALRSRQRTTDPVSSQHLKEAHHRKYTADGDSKNQEHVCTNAGADHQTDATALIHIAVNRHLGRKYASIIGNASPRTESNGRSNHIAARATLKRATFKRWIEVSTVSQYHASNSSSASSHAGLNGREKLQVAREVLTRTALTRWMEGGSASHYHASTDSSVSSHAKLSSKTHSRMYTADDGSVSQYQASINNRASPHIEPKDGMSRQVSTSASKRATFGSVRQCHASTSSIALSLVESHGGPKQLDARDTLTRAARKRWIADGRVSHFHVSISKNASSQAKLSNKIHNRVYTVEEGSVRQFHASTNQQ